MAADCVFCKIASGQAQAYTIYEDKCVLVFLDLFPANPGHCLIITKRHSDDIFSVEPADIAAVAQLSVPLARAIDSVTGCGGLGVHQLNRAAAGQTVFHYHMHLIPQSSGAGLSIHGRAMGDEAELATMAKALTAALQRELKTGGVRQ
ncbi:MAG: histidine triad (HIT) family protein [Paracoccaceae bacterium]